MKKTILIIAVISLIGTLISIVTYEISGGLKYESLEEFADENMQVNNYLR